MDFNPRRLIGNEYNMTEIQKIKTFLNKYKATVYQTDRIPLKVLTPIKFGLFGEIGSLMSTSKKYYREGDVYLRYRENVEEEFGDVLWYFFTYCRRLKIDPVNLIINKLSEYCDLTLSLVIFYPIYLI